MHTFFTVSLAVLVVLFVSIAEVYHSVPLVELKRRIRDGDGLAKSIYKVASYRASAQFLLWLLSAASATGFFILVNRHTSLWVTITATFALIWFGFVWLPRLGMSKFSQYIASLLAPPLSKLLFYLHPITRHGSKRFNKRDFESHTGIYESDDLIRLLNKQADQQDNRVDGLELNVLKNVLTFNSKTVAEIMVPKRKVKTISSDELLGPIVMNELHRSGQYFYPVYEKEHDNLIGVLDVRLLSINKESVMVSELMVAQLAYVHEDQLLKDTLQTMLKTNHPLFVVVDSNTKYIGIVLARDVLAALVGDQLIDEFSEYDNAAAVVEHFKRPHHEETPTEEPSITSEPPEMIE